MGKNHQSKTETHAHAHANDAEVSKPPEPTAKAKGSRIQMKWLAFWQRFQSFFYDKKSSSLEIRLAIATGVFWGLNPLLGSHFYLIAATVYLCRIAWKKRLSIGLAYVCSYILNPLTILPFFSLFYWSGISLFQLVGATVQKEMSFAEVQLLLESLTELAALDALQAVFRFFFLDLGIPILVGSIPVGIAGAFIAFMVAGFFVKRQVASIVSVKSVERESVKSAERVSVKSVERVSVKSAERE